MLIGYMRVSSSDERQVVDLQLDALLAAGVDERHLPPRLTLRDLEASLRRVCAHPTLPPLGGRP
jgi:hypothetical protein